MITYNIINLSFMYVEKANKKKILKLYKNNNQILIKKKNYLCLYNWKIIFINLINKY